VSRVRGIRGIAVLAALAVPVLLGGCGGASTSAGGSSSAPAAPVPSAASPTPTVSAEEQEAASRLAAMSVREKLATMLMLHRPGTDPADLHDFMAGTGAGGFILMGDNVAGSVQDLAGTAAGLQVDDSLPPLIGIDQEGGDVSRIGVDDGPGAAELRDEPPAASRTAFAARAALVREAGANLNFGIIADVTGDPDSFIADRVLGSDPDRAGDRVEQAVLGERGIVLSTLKHFPGHGLTAENSHTSLPQSDISLEDWRKGPALPFERGIGAGAEAVMFGHLRLDSVDSAPASLSAAWHRILRDELHFEGLAVTDDMLMLQHSGNDTYADPLANAIQAIDAGNDVLLYVLAEDPEVSGVDPEELLSGLVTAVEDGGIPEERVDDSVRRLLLTRIGIRDHSGTVPAAG
jgi:beta-N-acetylhexosaminidase